MEHVRHVLDFASFYFRFGSCIVSLARKDDDLIEIRISTIIVEQRHRSQLDVETIEQRPSPVNAYLLHILSILVPCVDHQEEIEQTQRYHSDINGQIPCKISVGEDIAPVDGRWENKETTRKCCQVTREALCLVMISQWSHLNVAWNHHEKVSEANDTYDDAVRSPTVPCIQIVTTGQVDA